MPWKVKGTMDLKREFVRRHKAGERMTDLCREYQISRETGHALVRRYEAGGEQGLVPRSRAPHHSPRRTAEVLVDLMVAERVAHPSWGARKIKAVIERREGFKLPSTTTIHHALQRRGLVAQRRRRRPSAPPRTMGLRNATSPNEVWCVDYKGQFRLGNRTLCYPFTLTDQVSRYLLACDGMEAIDSDEAWEASANAFRRYGLPLVIRSDNGSPFAASRGLAGLSSLAAAWMRLGIELERIEPGHPEQNGRHERMHRTLKHETTRPASANLLSQQERFDRFVEEFNNVRPHEALGDQTPASMYHPSERPFPGTFPEPDYPLHDDILVVGRNGNVAIAGRRVFVSAALVGHPVGIREERDGRWLLTFMHLDLGHLDPATNTFSPLVDGERA